MELVPQMAYTWAKPFTFPEAAVIWNTQKARAPFMSSDLMKMIVRAGVICRPMTTVNQKPGPLRFLSKKTMYVGEGPRSRTRDRRIPCKTIRINRSTGCDWCVSRDKRWPSAQLPHLELDSPYFAAETTTYLRYQNFSIDHAHPFIILHLWIQNKIKEQS